MLDKRLYVLNNNDVFIVSTMCLIAFLENGCIDRLFPRWGISSLFQIEWRSLCTSEHIFLLPA